MSTHVEIIVMVVQALCTLAMVLAGIVMKRLWKELDDLKASETQTRAELNAVNLQIARDYPTREDLQRVEIRIRDGFEKVSRDTEKLFDKLDMKVNKDECKHCCS